MKAITGVLIPGKRDRATSVSGRFSRLILSVVAFVPFISPVGVAADFTVISPDENIEAVLTFNEEQGQLSYSVRSRGQEVIDPSPIGINTDQGDFRSGMKFIGTSTQVIDETYTLPQGKVYAYHNHAGERTMRLGDDAAR
jgi:hypothetical protein